VFLAAGLASAVLNAASQRISAARVGVDDLGALNALLAVVGALGLLGVGLQVVLVRAGTPRLAIARVAAAAAAVCGASSAAVAPGPAWYRLGIGAVVAGAVVAVLVGVPHRARILADSSWRRLGAVHLGGAAARLALLAPAFALVDNRLLAAMSAAVAGEATASAVAWAMARPQYRGAWSAPPQRIDAASARMLARSSAVLVGLCSLTVVDSVVARSRLSPAEADGYAFASTVARSSFFLAVLVAHLALPTFMHERGRSARLRRAFGVASTTTAVIAFAAATTIAVAPTWVSDVLLGDDAALVDVPTLRRLALVWASLAVLPLLTYFHLDRHPRLAWVPLAAAAVLTGLNAGVDDARVLASTTLVVVAAATAVMAVPALHRLAPVTRAAVWQGVAGARDAPPGRTADVAVVVPFYNPGPVVVDTVRRLGDALARSGASYRIVAVSDGSDDGSAEALARVADEHVDVVVMPSNRGKGAALRAGFARADATLVGYIDADGDLAPEQLVGLVEIAVTSGADAVIGSKLHPGSVLRVERHRHVMSSVFRATVRVLFRLDVRDTQTGLKLYRGDVVASLAPLLREDGFAIDVEILVAAMRARRLSIVEAPVEIVRSTGSTVSPRRAVVTLVGLLRISWRDHVALAYDRDAAFAAVPGP